MNAKVFVVSYIYPFRADKVNITLLAESFSHSLDLPYSRETLHETSKIFFWDGMCCLLLSWETVSSQGLSTIGSAGSLIAMNPEVWACARFKQSLDEADTNELEDSARRVHEQVLKSPNQRNTHEQLKADKIKETNNKNI